MKKSIEKSEKVLKGAESIIVEEKMQKIFDLSQSKITENPPVDRALQAMNKDSMIKIATENKSLSTLQEKSVTLKAFNNNDSALKALGKTGVGLKSFMDSSVVNTVGEFALSTHIPDYSFKNSMLEQINIGISGVLRMFNDRTAKILADSVKRVVRNFSGALVATMKSPAMDWIRSIDITPIRTMFEQLQMDSYIIKRYQDFSSVYFNAMYECKWFPYAGWSANIDLAAEISEILSTSRGASKRREQRIDKAVLSYYTLKEIKKIKRRWKNSDLEPHIKKILGQAIEAHLRGEYVLTITCLATMWEGLIHKKINIIGRYSQKKTKEDFVKLIDENDYEPIFSEFYKKLIVSQCDTPEEVIEGIPNRNGISHSKYKKYPNKKASLNAILLTDFIITLEPVANSEK